MKDLLASSRGSSPIREKASLSFSAVKSLVLREKEASELGTDDKGLCLITSLLDAGRCQFSGLLKLLPFCLLLLLQFYFKFQISYFCLLNCILWFSLPLHIGKLLVEGHSPERRVENGSETSTNSTSLPKDIHGAPPECFIIKLAKVIGSLKTLQRMALFWSKIIAEVSPRNLSS